MDEVMDHINSVEGEYSRAVLESQANADECVWELQAAGMVSHTEGSSASPPPTSGHAERIVSPDDDTLEDQ